MYEPVRLQSLLECPRCISRYAAAGFSNCQKLTFPGLVIFILRHLLCKLCISLGIGNHRIDADRHRLVLLLSRQDDSTISSSSGRETIKAEALQELRDVLEKEEGEPHIEDLIGTAFDDGGPALPPASDLLPPASSDAPVLPPRAD